MTRFPPFLPRRRHGESYGAVGGEDQRYAADGAPVSAEQEPDQFRRGILLVARATAAAEREWLVDTIAALTRAPEN